ncbi:MAG: cyclase family protein [Chloroflexi bacterium]|nr:cyclase family protein [Chloroflexota bacterium]MDL1885075.1 cyclase family protein [Anaerolineae bacterium CFX8]
MCSPEVAKVVRERVQKEGLSNLTRRNFLRLGGAAAASTAFASFVGSAALVKAQEASGEIVDLSHVFGSSIPTYLVNEKPHREDFVTVENDGFYIQRWNFTEHAGTHVDIPAHFISGGETVDNYPADLLVGPAVVIDISAKAAENADAALDVADIEAWESANGKIPTGAVVFLYSGWDVRWDDPEAFRNADANGVQHYPGFSPDAAAFLVEQRDIRGIGVDTLSLDIGASTTFDVHVTVLAAGKYGIEGVANLAAIKDRQATVFVGVPRWENGSGGPARVLAVI